MVHWNNAQDDVRLECARRNALYAFRTLNGEDDVPLEDVELDLELALEYVRQVLAERNGE